ncbi:MAG: site-specific integrase [Planctomycetaceae bacterium]|nr:site-specific integrase [Planctomycetaceae bacterium]
MSSKSRKVQVLKLPNKKSPYWYLRWWEYSEELGQWKERWKSTRTSVKKKAEELRRELERELDGGKVHESELSWKDFVELFMERHAARKPLTTQDAYRKSLDIFTKLGRARRLQEVTHAVLEDFATARLKQGMAPATANRDLRHLRAALKWARRRGYISEAPDFHGLFIKEDRKKPAVIPEEDFLAMVRALRSSDLKLTRCSADWWRMFLYLAYYLGMRRGELFGLEWKHVSLESLEVRVVAPTSKARSERVIPIAPEMAELLRAWKAITEDQKMVLPWPYDNYRPMYSDWHAIQSAAGIPEEEHYVPKNCRSSCASALIASNVPTIVVKDFLGHATVATTENYYVNTKPALRSAAAARKVRMDSCESDENEPSISEAENSSSEKM